METKPELTFDTKQEAVDYLASVPELVQSRKNPASFWEGGMYSLSLGEYDRPDYIVTRYRDGWGVKVVHYYYPGTWGAPQDGRIKDDIWRMRRENREAGW